MGDAADDMWDAAMRAEERETEIMLLCEEKPPRRCKWHFDYEVGMLECKTCGKFFDG